MSIPTDLSLKILAGDAKQTMFSLPETVLDDPVNFLQFGVNESV